MSAQGSEADERVHFSDDAMYGNVKIDVLILDSRTTQL
jgi:hypothetical protein